MPCMYSPINNARRIGLSIRVVVDTTDVLRRHTHTPAHTCFLHGTMPLIALLELSTCHGLAFNPCGSGLCS